MAFLYFQATICCNIQLIPCALPCRTTPCLPSACVLQWNCDSFATKLHEHEAVLQSYRIDDVALIQENKFCQEDPTPQIRGFDSVCEERDGSGTRHHQGGGLMVYTVRVFSPLYHPVQPPIRWDMKRSLPTWLGDVNVPLITSTSPHIVLTTHPTTKITCHGSIIKRSLPTWLGDVNVPLMTSPSPTSLLLLPQPPQLPVMARSLQGHYPHG